MLIASGLSGFIQTLETINMSWPRIDDRSVISSLPDNYRYARLKLAGIVARIAAVRLCYPGTLQVRRCTSNLVPRNCMMVRLR